MESPFIKCSVSIVANIAYAQQSELFPWFFTGVVFKRTSSVNFSFETYSFFCFVQPIKSSKAATMIKFLFISMPNNSVLLYWVCFYYEEHKCKIVNCRHIASSMLYENYPKQLYLSFVLWNNF